MVKIHGRFRVRPFPVSDDINIKVLSAKLYYLTVINSVGQEVLKTTLDFGKAIVKSLTRGQYQVVVQDESGKKVGQQIVLKHLAWDMSKLVFISVELPTINTRGCA